jgi:hypothetical protein
VQAEEVGLFSEVPMTLAEVPAELQKSVRVETLEKPSRMEKPEEPKRMDSLLPDHKPCMAKIPASLVGRDRARVVLVPVEILAPVRIFPMVAQRRAANCMEKPFLGSRGLAIPKVGQPAEVSRYLQLQKSVEAGIESRGKH